MDKRELDIIQELMNELQDHMEPKEDDFASRLGRTKPDVEIVKLGVDSDESDPMLSSDEDEDMPMSPMDQSEELSPEDKLKQRLLKIRS